MADEQPATRASKPDGSAPGRSPIVFVSDASAETERIGDALRGAGYIMAEVPLSNLSSRVAVQRPNIVVLDVDVEGALDKMAKLRKLPGSGSIDFVYLGTGDGIIKDVDDALSNDGSAFFVRPVDVGGLIRKIEALTGGPMVRPEAHPWIPPSSPPPSRSLLGSRSMSEVPPSSDRPSAPSLPAPGLRRSPLPQRMRTPGPPLPMSTTSLADLINTPRSLASFGTVSPELQQLLADAELRAESLPASEVALPSPEEEIEAVLPADILASLDEPIGGDEDEDGGGEGGGTGSGHDRDGTGTDAKGTTSGGSRQPTTGSGGRAPWTGSQTYERRVTSDTPSRSTTGGGSGGGIGTASGRPRGADVYQAQHDAVRPSESSGSDQPRGDVTRTEEARPRTEEARPRTEQVPAPGSRSNDSPPARPSSWHPPPAIAYASARAEQPSPPRADVEIMSGPSVQPDIAAAAVVVLGPASARRFFAEAIARRATGALCFESEGVVRRVVLRDGDLVAAASGGELESLVHFLAARGELSRDEAPRLAAKIPPYGRHAGAALVAHGWLRQDQLWVVLRAHAEWIAAAILRLSRGSAQLEPELPGRLRGEPSVFGAATGAEIFVELVRRAVPPDEALSLLGGEATRIADGPNHGLVAECNLSPQELELLHRARGGTIADLLARASDGEILAVIHALSLLGVIEPVLAPDFGRRESRARNDSAGPDSRDRAEPEVAALDEEAIRARVRARLELVEEGDYFSVLGVTRDATGYEVKRAFIELRRTFEPARILTPRLLDLADDVRKIVVVIEEAYEILRDGARRERYRRAIDAQPGS
jgi:hypothetical protein